MQLNQLPSTLARRLTDFTWQRDVLGESGAQTFRLQKGHETLFLKTVDPSLAAQLQAEAERMRWLHGRLATPTLLHFEVAAEGAFLLMTAVAGVDVTDFNQRSAKEKETAVRLLAEGLQQLHNLSIRDCPFDHKLDIQIEKALQRMSVELVDETDFDKEWLGRKTADLFAELLDTQPTGEDIVFTHGDYCLPNVMVANGRLSGFIDLGNAGIADRYQDLALCARSLVYNFGAGWEKQLFAHYGLPEPDEGKLVFYRLLDEFF
jgi:aminoglycoside phosphotransferase